MLGLRAVNKSVFHRPLKLLTDFQESIGQVHRGPLQPQVLHPGASRLQRPGGRPRRTAVLPLGPGPGSPERGMAPVRRTVWPLALAVVPMPADCAPAGRPPPPSRGLISKPRELGRRWPGRACRVAWRSNPMRIMGVNVPRVYSPMLGTMCLSTVTRYVSSVRCAGLGRRAGSSFSSQSLSHAETVVLPVGKSPPRSRSAIIWCSRALASLSVWAVAVARFLPLPIGTLTRKLLPLFWMLITYPREDGTLRVSFRQTGRRWRTGPTWSPGVGPGA